MVLYGHGGHLGHVTKTIFITSMLHAMFQDNRTLGTRDKDFVRFLPWYYMGMVAILVM